MRRYSIGSSVAMVSLVAGGLWAAGSAVGIGAASACVTASGTAVVDCDGIQGGEMSGNTNGAVNGQGWIEGHGVEDYDGTHGDWESDGTQGDFCGGAVGEVPRC